MIYVVVNSTDGGKGWKMDQEQRANRAVRRSLHKSRGAKHRAEPRGTELDRWLLAGAVALGVGAAVAGGSGLAHADTGVAASSTPSGDHKRHIGGFAGSAVATSSMQDSTSSTVPTRSTPKVRTSADSDVTTAIAARTAVPTSIGPTHPRARLRSAAASPASSPRAVTGSPANSPATLSAVPGPLALIGHDLHQALSTTTSTVHPAQTVVGLLSRPIGALNPAAGNSNQTAVRATVAPKIEASTVGSATVPLRVNTSTEPVIDISVNGGPTKAVLVDTGSNGLVIGIQDIGLRHLGWPTGFGVSGYSGGLTYIYAKFNTTVNFGNGIVTGPTSVDVAILSFPEPFHRYVAPAGAVGVLGIGPNAAGPGPSSPIAALPGDLSDGVLIDEQHGVLEFGPNPLPARVSVAGAPNTSLKVQVGDGPLESVTAAIDSGGVYGTIPSSVIGGSQLSGGLPAGTVISVYTDDGQTLLYSYTIDATNSPTVTSDDVLNTGNEPFAQGPVYIAYSGNGTTIFDV